MRRDHIFKTETRFFNQCPIHMIMFLFFFDGFQLGSAKWWQAINRVQPLKSHEPARYRFMVDLQINHKTVTRWLMALERLYAIYRLPPFGAPKLKAVKKEQKHYHMDWTLVKEPGFRFENMIASHLLKWSQYMYDTQGRDVELRYFRDTQKREVDFVITEDQKPIQFI